VLTPTYAVLVEHGTFVGYNQGSEVYLLADALFQADEYTTPDGPWFDVYPFRGDPSRLPTDAAEKIVYAQE
jgi:hypothetical protein